MTHRRFTVPRYIYTGPGALENLRTVVAKRALIVTDSVLRNLGIVERVEKILHASNIETLVFDRVEPEPSIQTARTVFTIAQDFKPDLFIGLGGGSPMDVGKIAWVLYENPDMASLSFPDFRDKVPNCELRKKARYVAIATTSGTASEVTPGAVAVDLSMKPPYKTGVGTKEMVPDVAIVDPELTVSVPPDVTANTGFDALIHAIECYVLGPPSEIVDSLSLWAARTIWEWLPKAVANGKDMVARERMHTASLQAGMAFGNARLGLVHDTGHILGSTFHIPHGRACAFLLCQSFALIYPTRRDRFGSLATVLGITGRGHRGKAVNLLTHINELKQVVGIPLAIKDSGIESTRFQAELDSMADVYMDHFGRYIAEMAPEERRIAGGHPVTVDGIKEFFTHAWNGTWTELT